MKKKSNPYLAGILLFIISYILQIGGLIPLVWAKTMKSTYEFELADKVKDSDLANLFGISENLTADTKKVNVILCVGAVIFAVGLVIMIAATIVTIVKYKSQNSGSGNYYENHQNSSFNGGYGAASDHRFDAPVNRSAHNDFFNSNPNMSEKNYYNQSFYESSPGYSSGRKGLYQGSLMCLSGFYCGYNFPLCNNEEIIIGTNPQSCNIVLNNDGSGISRFHCSVKFDCFSNSYIVTDYSTNGTFVSNGRRLPSNVPVKLRRGETIFLCDGSNSFRME